MIRIRDREGERIAERSGSFVETDTVLAAIRGRLPLIPLEGQAHVIAVVLGRSDELAAERRALLEQAGCCAVGILRVRLGQRPAEPLAKVTKAGRANPPGAIGGREPLDQSVGVIHTRELGAAELAVVVIPVCTNGRIAKSLQNRALEVLLLPLQPPVRVVDHRPAQRLGFLLPWPRTASA